MLESFTVGASRWRTSGLAAHCGLPVPTVHRILWVLCPFGYLARDPDTREYRLGPAAISFMRSTPSPGDPRRPAMTALRSVWSATGECVTLSAYSGSSARRGWASSREETVAGRWSVAVPVVDRGGVSFSLAVGAALASLDLDRARRHLSVLGTAARSLARRLESGPCDDLAELEATAWVA